MVNGAYDAFRIIRVALLSIVGVVVYVQFGNLFGFATSASVEQFRTVAESIRIGPFYFQVTPLRFGTMGALVIPSAGLLLTRLNEPVRLKVFYAVCLFLFFGLVLKTAARGASIAGVTGLSLIVLYRIKSDGLRRIFPFMVMALPAIALGGIFGNAILPSENISDFVEMFQRKRDLLSINNLKYRYDLFMLAFENTSENPLGSGFTYFWKNFRYDESISYSSLLNGTGFVGFAAYFAMLGHLLINFFKSFRKRVSKDQSELAILGIATILVALLAAVVSESVVWHSVNTFVLWAILGACYAGTRNLRRSPARRIGI